MVWAVRADHPALAEGLDRLEDLAATEEIFTTLMGDQVEPRREFIEKNALSVTNLDV